MRGSRLLLRTTRSVLVQVSPYSTNRTVWESKLFPLHIPGKTLQVEYGVVTLGQGDQGEGQAGPAILAVHPAGSSYRQFSKLPGCVPDGYASKLVGLNMLGYGKSDPWPGGQEEPTLEDLVGMVEGVMEAEGSSQKWHFLGHSMGGGLLLAGAGLMPQISPKLLSLTVFEPNLFSLLTAGDREEREQAREGERFFDAMLAAAGREDWDAWGQTFYQFWFPGEWGSIEEGARAKLVNTTLPSTIQEIEALKWGIDQGPGYAEKMLSNLAAVRGRKAVILSHDPGPGSHKVSLAMANILHRRAGFTIVRAPAGGHMGPVTHTNQVLPLLLG